MVKASWITCGNNFASHIFKLIVKERQKKCSKSFLWSYFCQLDQIYGENNSNRPKFLYLYFSLEHHDEKHKTVLSYFNIKHIYPWNWKMLMLSYAHMLNKIESKQS